MDETFDESVGLRRGVKYGVMLSLSLCMLACALIWLVEKIF